MKKKWTALGAGALLVALAGVAYEVTFVLPPPDPAAKAAVGAKAPDFALPSTTGARLALAELTHERSVVLVFYRGDW